MDNDCFMLSDTRYGKKHLFLSFDEARAVLIGSSIGGASEFGEWAEENRYSIKMDGWYVPLATADLLTMQLVSLTSRSASLNLK